MYHGVLLREIHPYTVYGPTRQIIVEGITRAFQLWHITNLFYYTRHPNKRQW